MSTTETEMTPEPDWLAAEPTARAKVSAIMAAVRRCYRVCSAPGDPERDGPHLSTTMAEVFIGQLMADDTARRNREMEAVFADMDDLLDACGLGRGARPYSPHEVMRQIIDQVAKLRETP